jgi:hypothetical protein
MSSPVIPRRRPVSTIIAADCGPAVNEHLVYVSGITINAEERRIFL